LSAVPGNFARVWTEPILHVDMDSFFVEVERVRDPSLVGRPVAVGGTGGRGVIASASYEAREMGVHSAQPTATALRLCPQLIVVSPTHGRYGEVSVRVFEIFRSFTPMVEGLSVDEAFLDVRGLRHHYSTPVAVAVAIRERIREEMSLPASVGIAASKFVAKLASAAAKPDGYRLVPRESQLVFLHALPIQDLWGVGPATMAAMSKLGVETVGDLAELPETAAVTALGPAQGRHLIDLARGHDPRPVESDFASKSISVEQTFDEDLGSPEEIESCLLAHAQRLSGRLRRAGLAARTVTLKMRYSDFTTLTRSITFDDLVDTPRNLFLIGRELLDQLDTTRPVRLLGLAGTSLEMSRAPRQMSLDSDENWDRVAAAVSDVRDRYGDHAIEPARLLNTKSQETEG
jgi:DNA polymerase-4